MTWLRNSLAVAPMLMGMVFTGVCSAAGAQTDNDWFQGRSVRPADTAPAGNGQGPGMGLMGGRDFGHGLPPQNIAPPAGFQGNQAGQSDFPADQLQDWVMATARAAHARAMLHLAEKRLNDSVRDSQWTFEQSKEYRDAVADEKQAYNAYTAERRKALESVVKDPTYLAALELSDQLGDKIHQVRAVSKSRHAANEEVLAMASQRMEYASQAHAMERAALEKDSALQDARQKMVQANAKLTALQANFDTSIRMNPQIQQARQNLDEARVTLITAEAYASAAATAGDLATNYVFYRHRWDGLASPVVGPYGNMGYGY
jgi:hypothetical protein